MDDARDIIKELVPVNVDGVSITAQSEKSFETEDKAQLLFAAARDRLLDINNWLKLNHKLGAGFVLFHPDGTAYKKGIAQPGLYIRVEIPGPGNTAGDGYDWVRIEEVKELSDTALTSVGIRVRPSPVPGTDDEEVAHFYDQQSTSTFVVYKQGKQVNAVIFDRNTKVNTKGKSMLNKIRNILIGSGAIAAFSKIQWELLTDGFLGIE
jgi:hypothetical protein